MLQWMGGSRRKVNASRKSTQRRQKQYFEQRRRQQQHQQEAADGGNYFEGNRTYGQQSENSRSLDIVSLLHLSAAGQEHKSGCPIARENSEDDALNYLTLQHLPVGQSNDIKTQEHSEIWEARTSSSSSYQMGITYPKTISVSAPSNHAESLKTDSDKMNQLKMALDCQLSVIDILEDDEPISGCKNGLAHEAHVAFSIEGLGKVETETPVHSPEAHRRSLLHGFSSPPKATNIANSTKDLKSKMVNLERELDAMMQATDSPFCRSSVDQPFSSKKSVDSFCNQKQKLDFKEFSLFNDRNNSLHDLPGDDELFFGRKDSQESIWNASGILADDILDERGFHLSDKNWMDPVSADFLNSMEFRKEHLDKQEKRTTMRKEGRIGSTESPAPNFKYQKSENVSNFTPSDMTWHSSLGRDHGDLQDEFGDSCFVTDDATESLSLPSEESCSSTAEMGKRTSLNLKDKLAMRDHHDIFHSDGVYSEKDVSPGERNCDKWNTALKEHTYVRGKFSRTSNSSRSIPVPQLHTTSKKRLKPDHSRCFVAEHNNGVQKSGCNSSSETSGTMKHVSPGCRLWTEDPFHVIGDVELESNRSCLERLSKSSAKCSPGCNFTFETHDLCQPNMQNMPGSSIQYTCQVSAEREKFYKPLDVHGSLTPKRENIARQADRNSGVQVSDHGKFQPQRDESSGSKSLSSENRKSTGASSNPQIEYRDCKEPTCETLNMGESESKMNYFQHAEDIPSFETSKIFEGKQCNADRKCRSAQSSLFCQTGFGEREVEVIEPKQRKMGSDAPSTANSTCQVMMFDSCVLQLLCVQVLKQVSAEVTGKQAYE